MALGKLIFWQDLHIFQTMINSLFDAAKSGFELSLGLTGALCLWMGFMKVGEEAGAIRKMSKIVSPLFSRIFPEIPKDHPAIGSMMMNISANMLGLDNAATPMGLKAMKEMQTLNPEPEVATNAQIIKCFRIDDYSGKYSCIARYQWLFIACRSFFTDFDCYFFRNFGWIDICFCKAKNQPFR
jgi:hypothetical protein